MANPKDLKYTKTHEWARVEGTTVTVGITAFAVSQINEVIFMELPPKGKAVSADKPFGTIESVKAVFDLNSPFDGTVIDVNVAAAEKPETITQDPYGAGWMMKIQVPDASKAASLMDADAYEKFCSAEASHH